MAEMLSVADYERLAEERLGAGPWAYLSGGSGDESMRSEKGAPASEDRRQQGVSIPNAQYCLILARKAGIGAILRRRGRPDRQGKRLLDNGPGCIHGFDHDGRELPIRQNRHDLGRHRTRRIGVGQIGRRKEA